MTTKQKILAAAMILSVAVFHYFIPRDLLTLHVLFRLFYLVPIIYVALCMGRLGGILTAITVTFIFLPHFFMATTSHEFVAGNVGAVVLFNLAGYFVGNFRDRSEREVHEQKGKLQIVPIHKGEGGNILFYVDDTQLSKATVEWFSDFIGHGITTLALFGVYSEEESEKYPSQKQIEEHVAQLKIEKKLYLENIKEEFVEKGVASETISIKSVSRRGKASVSDKILDELKNGSYDLILLPKHNKTKAQEFLFGDTAIQLLRKAPIPVLSVKGGPEEQ